MVRRLSKPNLSNIEHIKDKIKFVDGDLLDQGSLISVVKQSNPDEVYNLAAQSFVGTSWQQPIYTNEVSGLGALRLFDAIRHTEDQLGKNVKIYQAGSSEQFGNTGGMLNEVSTMFPRSPYGLGKLFAHEAARIYRESYGMKIWRGICFNHSSKRRGQEFVTQKVATGTARIKLGIDKKLELGDIRSKRDWSYAGDIVEGMYLMLQKDEPDDFVLASGESHSVRELCQIAFDFVNLDWEQYVKFDKKLNRPADIYDLKGDYSKAKRILGWFPKVKFKELIEMMVQNQVEELK